MDGAQLQDVEVSLEPLQSMFQASKHLKAAMRNHDANIDARFRELHDAFIGFVRAPDPDFERTTREIEEGLKNPVRTRRC